MRSSAFLHSGEAAFRKRCSVASRLRGGRALGLPGALADADPGVRQVAARSLGRLKDDFQSGNLPGCWMTESICPCRSGDGARAVERQDSGFCVVREPERKQFTAYASCLRVRSSRLEFARRERLSGGRRSHRQRIALRVLDELGGELESCEGCAAFAISGHPCSSGGAPVISGRKELKEEMVRLFRELVAE